MYSSKPFLESSLVFNVAYPSVSLAVFNGAFPRGMLVVVNGCLS